MPFSRIEKLLEHIPDACGVYLMKDKHGKVVYVGKAINLRSRVSSYFQKSSDPRPFVRYLGDLLDKIDVILTRNEKEALILENELIKKYKPAFNILLKDDKNYLYLKLDLNVEFPKLELVRRRKDDGALYFGPYHVASSARSTYALINKYFGLRTCSERDFKNRTRPCIEYQMKRCLGPCVLSVDKEEYRMRVKEACLFLQGRHQEVLKDLRNRMFCASEQENFEEAARLRDQIRAIERALDRQGVVLPVERDVDAIGYARDADTASFCVLRFEKGALSDTIPYVHRKIVSPDEDVLEQFLMQYYQRAPIPNTVLVPKGVVGDLIAIADVLRQRAQKVVEVLEPVRGPYLDAMKIAVENARHALREALEDAEVAQYEVRKLCEMLDITHEIQRIEGYDMSTTMGDEYVGVMVVFRGARPEKASYRHFRIKGDVKSDVDAMREVLLRRFSRLKEEGGEKPDLVLLDGGMAQLNCGREVLEMTGFSDIPVVALAKERIDRSRRIGFPVHIPERIYFYSPSSGTGGVREEAQPLVPRQDDPGLRLLMRVRDEAHRCALRFHRKRRIRKGLLSVLEGVRGIGKKRLRALLQRFGSVRGIEEADFEEVAKVVGKKCAEEVLKALEAARQALPLSTHSH
jgi:excinuclease ABC subunit C